MKQFITVLTFIFSLSLFFSSCTENPLSDDVPQQIIPATLKKVRHNDVSLPIFQVSTVTSGIESTEVNSYSLSFDGTNDYALVNNFPNNLITDQLTLECWINLASSGNGVIRHIISKRVGNNIDFSLEISRDQKATIHLGIDGIHVFGSTTISNDVWVHVAITFDGSTVYIWVNGLLDTSLSLSGSINTFDDKFYIGQSGLSNPSYFVGLIDEIRISNIVRYTSNFTPQLSRFLSDANTVVLYNLNEGSGTQIIDASSNNKNGTTFGSIVWSSDVPFAESVTGAFVDITIRNSLSDSTLGIAITFEAFDASEISLGTDLVIFGDTKSNGKLIGRMEFPTINDDDLIDHIKTIQMNFTHQGLTFSTQ